MKKILTILFIIIVHPSLVFANQPKNWQLGFQDAASQSMRDIVWFQNLEVFQSKTLLFLQPLN